MNIEKAVTQLQEGVEISKSVSELHAMISEMTGGSILGYLTLAKIDDTVYEFEEALKKAISPYLFIDLLDKNLHGGALKLEVLSGRYIDLTKESINKLKSLARKYFKSNLYSIELTGSSDIAEALMKVQEGVEVGEVVEGLLSEAKMRPDWKLSTVRSLVTSSLFHKMQKDIYDGDEAQIERELEKYSNRLGITVDELDAAIGMKARDIVAKQNDEGYEYLDIFLKFLDEGK